jgi:hypothetical protein
MTSQPDMGMRLEIGELLHSVPNSSRIIWSIQTSAGCQSSDRAGADDL